MDLYLGNGAGKPSVNHTVAIKRLGMYLYSYGTLVCIKPWDGQGCMVFEGYDTSGTTLKYVQIFLDGDVVRGNVYRMDKQGMFYETDKPVQFFSACQV